jgi:hemerythrin superfamily protein
MLPSKPAAASRRTKKRNAIAILTDDHKELRRLARQYDRLVRLNACAEERGWLAHRICAALAAHALAEEEIFYPALRSAIVHRGLLDEAEIEHAFAGELVARIERMRPEDDKYDAHVTVLCQYVAHHLKEEETQIFPRARRASSLDIDALGAEMATRRNERQAIEAWLGAAEAGRPRAPAALSDASPLQPHLESLSPHFAFHATLEEIP